MAEKERLYRYVAMDAAGRRVSGEIQARSDGLVFERLKRDGFAPVRITPAPGKRQGGKTSRAEARSGGALSDRETAELLARRPATWPAGSSGPPR